MMKSASSAAGTSACTSSQFSHPSFAAKPRICPRRPVSKRCAAGVYSTGTLTVTPSTGSSNTEPALASPSCIAMRVAVAKAMSLLSTEWKPPSSRVTAMSTTGWPSGPFRAASSAAWPTAGMKRFGTAPPTTFSSKWKPDPRGRGAICSFTSANWPWPPVWRFSRACCTTAPRIVSRNATGARAVFSLAPPFAAKRSSAARRCISPWPASTVAPLSASCATDSAGSSSVKRCSAAERRTSSLRSSGAMDSAWTAGGGSGNGSAGPPRVAPVLTPSSRPIATRSPASACGTFRSSPPGKRWMPPARCPSSAAPSRSGPRQSRANDKRPAWPACTVRNTCASGPPSAGMPRRVAVSAAAGTSCRSAFHSRWTPLLFSAAPRRTPITAPLASPLRSGR